MSEIKVYGAPWCPDCKRAKKFLGEHRVAYRWIDIDEDREGLRFVEELQNGGRTIPTITFDDGSHLIEPSNHALAGKLGLQIQEERGFYDLIIVGGGPSVADRKRVSAILRRFVVGTRCRVGCRRRSRRASR